METVNPDRKKPIKRKWLKRMLLTLAILICIPVGLFTLGWLNRDTLINVLQEWYSENHNGTLSIGEVNTSFISSFPKIGFTVLDIEQTSIDTISDKHSAISIEQVKITVRPRDLLQGDIKIEKIDIKNATVFSEVIPTRPNTYYQQLKLDNANEPVDPLQLSELLNENKLQFSLENVTFISKDTTERKHFDLDFHKLNGRYDGDLGAITGDASLDVTVNLLGFNMKKGAFFNGARVQGKPEFKFNKKNHSIAVSEFPLHIDDQTFRLEANFDVGQTRTYAFRLTNPSTDFKLVKGLLTDSISAKLKDYQIIKTFKSELDLTGAFSYGNDPKVDVVFSSSENHVVISELYNLKDARFSGRLTTDIYATDSLKKAKKTSKDLKLYMDAFKADLDGIAVAVDSAYYMSTPEVLNYVYAPVQLKGSNEALTRLIDTDNFDFKGGNFDLAAQISGDIPVLTELANHAKGRFSLENTRVVLKSNGLQLPINSIVLDLDQDIANLRKLEILMPNGHTLVLKGWLSHPADLISKVPVSSTTSKIDLISNAINITEIIQMATEFLPEERSTSENRKTLHETLNTVYTQFHPQFNIDLKSMQFNDITLKDVRAHLSLTNAETISISEFDFKYDKAVTSLQGSLKVPLPNGRSKDPIVVDLEVNSLGPVQVFKDLFNIELLAIISGQYDFDGSVSGNIQEFNELLKTAKGNLVLTENHYYYQPADLDIKFDSLALDVRDSNITLEKFNLDLADLRPIELKGQIRKFPSFLLEDDSNPGSIDLSVSMPFLDGDDVLDMVASLSDEENNKINKPRKQLHSVFTDISHFDPDISLSIDSLKYKDLITKNIGAHLFFENDSTLNLDYLNIGYKSSQAQVIGKVITTKSDQNQLYSNPFEFNFIANAKGESKDLNDYLKTTNFVFNSGAFEFTGVYNGQSENLKLINNNTQGQLKLGPSVVYNEAAKLSIPIDSLNVEIENDVATLKKLQLDLPGRSSVDFSGTIDHFSSFVNSTNEIDNQRSNFNIKSSYLDTKDIKAFLSSTRKSVEDTTKTNINLNGLKKALNGINTSFNPTLNIELDSLRHENLEIENFGSVLFFDRSDRFHISETALDFFGGAADLDLKFGLASQEKLPVDIDMNVTHIDLNALISGLNYLDNDALKNTDTIEGTLNYKLQATGWLDNEGKLDMGSLNGSLTLDIIDLAIYGFQPIMDNVPLMKAERFEQLRFQPIVQTFEVVDGKILIPRTEIQSSALHFFVEGQFKMNEFVNVWISLPWKNLKGNDGLILPEKTGFENAGSKFYVQLIQNNNDPKPKHQELKVKLRLSNRKLRKQKEDLKNNK
ncbi:AsmA family protein [Sediminibacter sp. Hel_I_10]|uniref:AsmA family protein n=1 Tax=Sediminibacter sp. Hel_I_10 TaxID=1392490 RepID=UPI00047C895A|nr:AsmA family protein [Sediminibacter sp. Hel_I_10]